MKSLIHHGILRSSLSLALGFLTATCTSCVTTPTISEEARTSATTFSPPPGKSLIYVYRPSKFIGAALRGRVWINQQQVGETGNGTFMAIPISPGKYSIQGGGALFATFEKINQTEPEVTLTAKAGEVYLIRQSVSMGRTSAYILQTGSGPIPIGTGDFYFSAQRVDDSTGKTELQKLRQVGAEFGL